MVQILPQAQRDPSIGEKFSSGLSQGLSGSLSYAQQLGIEKKKQQQRMQNIASLQGQSTSGLSKQFSDEINKDPFGKAKDASILGEPELARIFTEEGKLEEKRKMTRAAGHEEIAKQTLKSSAEQSELLPQKEFALQNMVDALENGDLSFFSPDSLADATGIEAFRTPEGAGFKTAGKEFFLGSLKRAGARPNQWIEQQISDMLPKIGRSPEANLSVTEALKMEMDIQKKQIELTNSIADEMEADFGYVKRDLADQVRKRITPYANEKQKELQKSLMEIKDLYEPSNKSGYLMYDPTGNLMRVPKKEVPDAKKEGYRLYK